jgi:hypothetical protein
MIQQGLDSEDWKAINSKVKRANVEQLIFLKGVIDTEIIKRTGQTVQPLNAGE